MSFGKSTQPYQQPVQTPATAEVANQKKGATDAEKMKKKRDNAFGADTATNMGSLLPNLTSMDTTLASGSLLGLSDTIGR